RLLISLLLVLVSSVGCAADPVQVNEPQPSAELAVVRPRLDESFRLRAGELASLEGVDLLVAFGGATNDSRCPVDVNCVWAGDAELTIGLASDGGSWSWTVLHTTLQPTSREVNDFTIAVEGLEPEPLASVAIQPDDYVAILRVTRE